MKIRHGFVSNSSSSSFILALPKHIGSVEKAGELLFGKAWDGESMVKYYDDGFSQRTIAETFYNDVCKAKKENIENKVSQEDLIRGIVEYGEVSQDQINDLLKSDPKRIILSLEYSDNDGSLGCTMEHGDVFDLIPHVRVSHH